MASKTWYLEESNGYLYWSPTVSSTTGTVDSSTRWFDLTRESGTQYAFMNNGTDRDNSEFTTTLSNVQSLSSVTATQNVTGGVPNVEPASSGSIIHQEGICLLYPYNTVFDAGQWSLDLTIQNTRASSPRMDCRVGAFMLRGKWNEINNTSWVGQGSNDGAIQMYSDANLTTTITTAESQLESNLSGTSPTTMQISWYCDRFALSGDWSSFRSGNGTYWYPFLFFPIYFKLDGSSRTRPNEGAVIQYGVSSGSTLVSPNIRKKIRVTQ